MASPFNGTPALTWFDGRWLSGNPPIMGPLTHGVWMASVVFDGARAFEGVTPDLDRHCQRTVDSARAMGLKPPVSGGEIEEIVRDGVARFPSGTPLYIRPMMYAEEGFVNPDPATTQVAISLIESPMPTPKGTRVTLTRHRRPGPDMAPTNAKAACLYPNSARGLREAAAKGFDNAVVLDPLGYVAELCTANLFLVKDGVVHTPADNGTFLAGITRARVIDLLRQAGRTVHARSVTVDEVLDADELFSTGNYGKVLPITQIETRDLQPGPIYAEARQMYWDYAHA